ncbi:MAG: hypothetical protein GDA56_21250 [Hormoscilla sp. GM7CHS1pb]|nr:hypothetical protein [Hormoscilla sp. GM7CHS1pb]
MQPTDSSKFTDKAWEAIVNSQDVARRGKHQQLEVEHVTIAMLEQDGIAKTILDKAGIDPVKLSGSHSSPEKYKYRVLSLIIISHP